MKKLLPALLFVVLLASARAVPAVLSARQARLPAGVTGELVAHAIESGGLERTYRAKRAAGSRCSPRAPVR
jgi:hypothetical protein